MGFKTTDDQQPPLTNVHDALHDAVLEAKSQESPMVPVVFRAPEDIKHQAQEICARHGVDISSFLRHCLNALVKDYRA